MTQLQIKKADKAELAQLIEWEIAAYKNTIQGRNPQSGEYLSYGALLECIFEAKGFQNKPFEDYAEYVKKGYAVSGLTTDILNEPQYGTKALRMYMVKPEAPAKDVKGNDVRVEGVQYQCDEISKLIAEVTAKYEASIEAHNERVFEQERAAMLIEEEEARKAIQREDAAKAEAEIDKRVQARIRGLRGAK